MDENQAQMETPNVGGTLPPQPQPELSLIDLKNIRSVLDVAVKRGTFAASELSAIGSVYDKLNSFLVAVEKSTPPQEAPTQG